MVFDLVLEWAHLLGICRHHHLDDWLFIADSPPHLSEHCCPLQFRQVLEIVISVEKLDHKLTQRARYLGMLVYHLHYLKKIINIRLLNHQIPGHSSHVPIVMASLVFYPAWEAWNLLQWQLKSHWSCLEDNSSIPIPSLEGCKINNNWWMQEKNLLAWVPLQLTPSFPPLHWHTTDCFKKQTNT